MARLEVFERALLEEVVKQAAQYDTYTAVAGPSRERSPRPFSYAPAPPLPSMAGVFFGPTDKPKAAPAPKEAPAPPPAAVEAAPAPTPELAPPAPPASPPPAVAPPPTPAPQPTPAAPPPKAVAAPAPPPAPSPTTITPAAPPPPAAKPPQPPVAPPAAPAAAPASPPPAASPALHKILRETPVRTPAPAAAAPIEPRPTVLHKALTGAPQRSGRFKQLLTSGKMETYKFEPFQTEEGIRKRWGDNEFNSFAGSVDQAGFKFKDPRERLNFLNTIDAESSGKGYGRVGVGDKQLPGGGSYGPLQIYASRAQDQDVNRMFNLRGGVREMYERHPDLYYRYGAKLYNERGLNPWQTSAKKRGVMPVEDRFLVG